MQPFTTTSSPRCRRWPRATGAINLGQGFPDTDGPARGARRRRRARSAAGRNQYPPGPGRARSCATAIAAHQRRFYGLDVDPDTRGAGDRRRHRGDRRGRARAVRARRRGRRPSSRTTTPTPPRSRWPARSRRTVVAARRPTSPSTWTTLRAAFAPAHPAGAGQLAAQPDRQGVHAAPSSSWSPRWRVEHDLIVVTDEVYEHLAFDGVEHVPARHAARAWRERTLTISSAGKTFSVTGWKIGWVHGPGRAGGGGADGQAVPHLRRRRPVPAGGRASALGLRRRRTSTGWRRRCSAKRDLLCDGLRGGRLRGVPAGRAPTSSSPTSAPLGRRRRRWRSAARCPALCGRGRRCRCRSSTTTPTAAGTLVRFAFCKRDDVLTEAVDAAGEAGRSATRLAVLIGQVGAPPRTEADLDVRRDLRVWFGSRQAPSQTQEVPRGSP